MAQAQSSGKGEARKEQLSPEPRNSPRGKPPLRLRLELILRRDVEGMEAFDELETKLLGALREQFGFVPEGECPSSQSESQGPGYSWLFTAACLGKYLTGEHVHVRTVKGFSGAYDRFLLEVWEEAKE
jgi:hypothetical protein